MTTVLLSGEKIFKENYRLEIVDYVCRLFFPIKKWINERFFIIHNDIENKITKPEILTYGFSICRWMNFQIRYIIKINRWLKEKKSIAINTKC